MFTKAENHISLLVTSTPFVPVIYMEKITLRFEYRSVNHTMSREDSVQILDVLVYCVPKNIIFTSI